MSWSKSKGLHAEMMGGPNTGGAGEGGDFVGRRILEVSGGGAGSDLANW